MPDPTQLTPTGERYRDTVREATAALLRLVALLAVGLQLYTPADDVALLGVPMAVEALLASQGASDRLASTVSPNKPPNALPATGVEGSR